MNDEGTNATKLKAKSKELKDWVMSLDKNAKIEKWKLSVENNRDDVLFELHAIVSIKKVKK